MAKKNSPISKHLKDIQFQGREVNWVSDLTTKPLTKSSLPFGHGRHAFGQDASNASHEHEGFVGPSHACHGFLIQLVFHFSHVFFESISRSGWGQKLKK
jgi:hypothetical protein